MKTYSMNDYIYFKLTPKGKEIWDAHNAKMNKLNPGIGWSIPYIGGGWVKRQLWSIIGFFGSRIGAGSDIFIYDITFENPLEDKMKKDEFEQIEKLVLQLREIEKAINPSPVRQCSAYQFLGKPAIGIEKEIGEPALLMYAEKLKAELKELGYEE